jgi:hypothetical protein
MDSARTQSGKDSIFRLEAIENGLVVHKALPADQAAPFCQAANAQAATMIAD